MGVPKYLRIADQLRIRICLNGHRPGEKLPTEMELCEKFNASRGTVRQALELLVKEGVIRRRKSAGTVVIGPPFKPAQRKQFVAFVPNVFNPEFTRFLYALRGLAIEQDIWLSCVAWNDHPIDREGFQEAAVRPKASGAIVFPTIKFDGPLYDWLRGYGIPYVVVNDFWTDSTDHDLVAYDELAAVNQAVDHLADLGHRRIVLVETNSGWARSRLVDRFLAALKRRDLPHDERHLFLCDPCNPPLERLYTADGVQPTAIITLYELPSAGVIRQLARFRRRVPQDVSVINVGCRPISDLPDRDVTAVDAPNDKMAACALDLLTHPAAHGQVRRHLFKPVFHGGNTTAACPENAGVSTSSALGPLNAGAAGARPVSEGVPTN